MLLRGYSGILARFMADDQQKPAFDFTEEQLQAIKMWRLAWMPLRIILGLAFFSLVAGGFGPFFRSTPGKVFAALFVTMVVVERLVQYPDAGGRRRDRGSVVVLWCGFGFSYMLAIVDYFWFPAGWKLLEWNPWYLPAGAGIYALGQAIRVVAIRTLGKFFTVSVRLKSDHRVVQHGIYRRIRHPAYTGLWLIALGFITLFASAAAYVYFVTIGTASLLYRIRVEERALQAEFGDEYTAYMRRTRRLVPWLL